MTNQFVHLTNWKMHPSVQVKSSTIYSVKTTLAWSAELSRTPSLVWKAYNLQFKLRDLTTDQHSINKYLASCECLSKAWGKYVSRLENLLLAMNITSASRKKALLLHYVGEEVNEIFDTLDVEEADRDEDVFKKAEKALRDYFTPQKNIEYEVYKFRQAKQLPDENITTYYTRLKQLARSCDFYDEKREIKTQIIQNGISSKLRRKALSDPEITLEKLLQIAKAVELSELQADGIESANRITHKFKYHESRKNSRKRSETNPKPKCHFCGYEHLIGKTNCPAYGKQCRKCQKYNHFKACCYDKQSDKREKNNEQFRRNERLSRREQSTSRRRRVNNLNEEKIESSSEEEYLFSTLTVGSISSPKKLPKFQVKVNGSLITIMADTGASVNILDELSYDKLETKPKLFKVNEKIFPYGSNTPLPVIGKCQCEIETAKKFGVETFFVVKGKAGCLVSWESLQRLGLVQVVQNVKKFEGNRSNVEVSKEKNFDLPKVETSTRVMGSDCETNKVETLIQRYSDVFHGLGKLKGFQVHLHVDKDVQPIAQSPRRVPFHVRQDLEEQLRRDEELGVIEKTEGPTPWVSPVVVVPKKEGKVRVCIDMRQVNKAIKRERHVTPTISEIVNDLNGAKIFNKLDLNQGYNQLELDQDHDILQPSQRIWGSDVSDD